ncbi:DUF305 domain-containing protein [Agromyces mariniharenae]|uniref:DUF305 domain-containing protein n=1 Tax=Agromyces mariniharenae TaxID=2604423 RepID=A0A5S4UUK6_9MICO|nr:DUF305 domain-containing protein [Agromyces mariniharenae]TYL50617.1 DUF305 domain-containing protein [Agromyces mariniharenae]
MTVERLPRGAGPRRSALATAPALALALALVAGVAGCTAGTGTAATTPTFVTPAPPPGSESDGTAAGAPADQSATEADLDFVAAMIVHHEQAVELAELAPGRVDDAELADLAERIALVQADEAEQMRTWLERRSTRDDAGDAHGHADDMAGAISRSTLDRASELQGTAFDRLFIEAMVPHHRGAIEMAETRLAEPGDSAVTRWARAIATAQALEIDRLLEVEARLPAG